MLITKVSDILSVEDKGPTRSGGVHLSSILNAVGLKMGFIRTSKAGKDAAANDITRNNYFETGFTVERMLELALGDRVGIRPGEIIYDGIACTPDGILFSPDGSVTVVEIKCTWMSVRDPALIWKWMAQIMGYCYVLATHDADLHVLWINGDYKPPKPVYAQYHIVFSTQELTENWRMVLNNKGLVA